MPLEDFNYFLVKSGFSPFLSQKMDYFDARQYISDKNKKIDQLILFKKPQYSNLTPEQEQDRAFEFIQIYTG